MSGVYPVTFDTCDGENFFTPGVVDTAEIVGENLGSSAGSVTGACYEFTNLTVGQYDERGLFGILNFDTQMPIGSCDACGLAVAPPPAPSRDDRCESTAIVALPDTVEAETIAGDSGQYLVATGYSATYVLSLAQPETPTLLSTLDVHGTAAAARGSVVYIAGSEGVRWIDLADPVQPQAAPEKLDVAIAYDAAIAGDLLFLAAWEDGLVVYDISDPHHPVERDRVGGWLLDKVAVAGSTVAASDNLGSLILFDAADPDAVAPQGVLSLAASGLGSVTIGGRHAYIASPDRRAIFIVDIADLKTPVLVGSYGNFSTVITQIALMGTRLLVTKPQGDEVIELDVSDPARPKEIINFLPLDRANDVVAQGPYAYALSWSGSVLPLRCPLPGPASPAPNVQPGACTQQAAQLYAAGSPLVHTLAAAVRLKGKLYKIHLISANPELKFTMTNLVNGSADWAAQNEITGLLVTADEEIVTDITTIRNALLALNAADDLYGKYHDVPLITLDSEYDAALDGLNGLYLGAMSPGALIKQPSAVLAGAMQQLLQDQTIAADLAARLEQATVDDAQPVEQLTDGMIKAALAGLDDQSLFPALKEDVTAVTAELKNAGTVLRGAKLVSFAVKLVAVIDMQAERAAWLREYLDAFQFGAGALDPAQMEAADKALQEVDDLWLRRRDHAIQVMLDTAVGMAIDLTTDAGVEIGKTLAARYGVAGLGSLAAVVPLAFSVNGALYGTDELVADFRLGEQAESLRRVFAAGKELLVQRAAESAPPVEEGITVYDGDLAVQYRSAYLLETAAAALSNRLYGKGYQAIYRLPNFSMALDLLQGGIRRTAAEDMVNIADEKERAATQQMLRPAFLNEALTLAVSACKLDATFVRQDLPAAAASTGATAGGAASAPVVNKIPGLEAYELLRLGTPSQPALGALGDRALVVYDLTTGRERFRIEPLDGIQSAAGAFGSDVLVTCSKQGTLVSHNLLTGEPILTYDQESVLDLPTEGPGCHVQLAMDGRVLVSTLWGTAYLWDVETGQPLGEAHFSPGRILSIAVSKSGEKLLVGSTLANMQMLTLPELKLEDELPLTDALASGIVGYEDFLLTQSADEVALWQRLGDDKVRSVPINGFMARVGVSEDRTKIAATVDPHSVEIWTVKAWNDVILTQTISETNVSALGFDASGSLLYVADNQASELRVWNLDAIDEPAPERPESVQLTVLVDKLNVRSGPSKEKPVLAQVNTGDVLQALDVTEDWQWLMVCCVDGEPGWVFNSPKFVSITPEDGLDRLIHEAP